MLTALIKFLRARLDEDARSAQRMQHSNVDDGGYFSCPAVHTEPYGDLPWGEDACDCHLERRRKRELAEVDTKRRIIDLCEGAIEAGEIKPNSTWNDDAAGAVVGEHVLILLALPYSDHPNYDPLWVLPL